MAVPYWDIELIVRAQGARLLLTTWLGYSLLAIALLIWTAGVTALVAIGQRSRNRYTGASCGGCGYPTRGILGGRCPECGADYQHVGIRKPRPGGLPLAVPIIGWCVATGPATIMLWALAAEWLSPRVAIDASVHPFAGYLHPWWFHAVALLVAALAWVTGIFALIHATRPSSS